MNTCDKKIGPLQLTGSQMNFSLRSNHISVSESPQSKTRPHSAVLPHTGHPECKIKCIRPKSAESNVRTKSQQLNWSNLLSDRRIKVSERSSLLTSLYTDSSSKLLQSLLGRETDNVTKDTISKSKEVEIEVTEFTQNPNISAKITPRQNDVPTKLDTTTEHKEPEIDSYTSSNLLNPLTEITDFSVEMNKDHEQSYKTHQWVSESGTMGEKTVRFLEKDQGYQEDLERRVHHHCRNHNIHLCCKHREHWPRNLNIFKSHIEDTQPIVVSETESDTDKVPDKIPKQAEEVKNDDNVLNILENSVRTKVVVTDDDGSEKFQKKWLSEEELQESVRDSKTSPKNCPVEVSKPIISSVDSSSTPNEQSQESDSSMGELSSEPKEVSRDLGRFDRNTETSFVEKLNNGSTYEEIVQLLQTLEEEDTENLSKKGSRVNSPLTFESTDGKIDQLDEVYSYLKEVEKDSELLGINTTNNTEKGVSTLRKTFSSPRLEELLNKNSVELAHEVLSLKIQIEDQKKGIKLLRETLAEMKEANKTADLAHQEALHKANAEAEALVQRHQKFIKQLLNEKKKLNETVSKLVEDLKSGEERYKRNVKAVEEKHLIEMKRVKEAQAVADKLKREKWMEAKTQKIKEMTVKGLEPELSRMAAAQQQEMIELRNLHRTEIEAVELRAARRTSELMDQLRSELTKEKENAIERENGALRVKMEKQFEEERNKLERYIQKLKDEIRRGEERLNNLEIEFQQRLLDCKKEAEKERQKMVQDFQEKLEETRRRHLVETKNLRESLEAEKEVWMNSYKKQQTAKFLEREGELHQQYKKERDRDIEVIIETLEKESTQAQKELKEAADNKLKRLKEKLENELKEVEASEAFLKNKLSEVKSLVLEKDDLITELNSQIRQIQTELSFVKKTCEDMATERTNLKEIIRKEFELNIQEQVKEKENLEREILAIKESHLKELAIKDEINAHNKSEMQKELTRVYSRIKAAVGKKDQIIESLRDENKAIMNRCQHLELMLDRQRRNLLLQ